MTDSAVRWHDVPFRKSSFSGSSGGNCVEVAVADALFGLRDSKNPTGPVLAVAASHGCLFLTAVKAATL
ncbi:MAG: DUF397 domain-containing protein [Labedaea sp.]